MAIINICPVVIDLCVTRADSTAFAFTIQDEAGTAIDITSYTFLLTVDPSDEPADALNNLFQLTGTITDAPNGVVEFAPTFTNLTQTPSDYFFDVQMTTNLGAIRTIIKGKFTIKQDITK